MIDKSILAVVTSPKTFLDNNFDKYDEDGLFSQRIFGPIKNYKCLCGNLSAKTQYAGQRCQKCGVMCTDNDVRYKTFAKIVLPFPIYKPTSRNKVTLSNIVAHKKHKAKYLLDPSQSDLSNREQNFLKYDHGADTCRVVKEYDPKNCIPLCITGTHTLYLALLSCWQLFGSKFARKVIENCFDYELIVTPPGTRHILLQTKDGNLSVSQHEVNDHYIDILKLCQFDWTNVVTDPNKTREMYLLMIQNTIGNVLPIIDEDLNFYDQASCKYQYYTNKIYEKITESLSRKKGYIRKDFLGRSIDFSSRSHIIIDPALKAYEIKMPKNNFIRLWFIEYMRFLKEHKNVKIEDLLAVVKLTETKITGKFPQFIDEFIEYIFSEKVDYKNRIVLINRQPTLFRYGIPAVQVVGVNENDCISVSPLMIDALNGDFDGDTMAIYRIHDYDAQVELEEKAYILNNVIYDQNPNYIQSIKGEAVYAAFSLLDSIPDLSIDMLEISNLNQLPSNRDEDFYTLFNTTVPVKFNGEVYSYGVCLFNKWCGFESILMTKFNNSDAISHVLYKNSTSNSDYHDKLTTLMKKLFWYSSINPKDPLTLSLSEIISINVDEQKILLEKLPKSPYIGQHLYKGLIKRMYSNIPKDHFFQKLIGAKLGKVETQLARMIGSIGYIADDQNIISSTPISDSILNGLDPETFFRTAIGARKGLVDKSKATPDSGYLERSLVVNLSPAEIGSYDCGTNLGFPIKIVSKRHAKSLLSRYYTDENNQWKLFTEDDLDKHIGEELIFRSPIICNEPGFKVCRKCFGEYHISTPFVGILAGQYISERINVSPFQQ